MSLSSDPEIRGAGSTENLPVDGIFLGGMGQPMPSLNCTVLHLDGPCPGYPHPSIAVPSDSTEAVPEDGDRTMSTKKIRDMPIPCAHPAHNPPAHQVFDVGVYEHVCPACGHRTTFAVNRF